MDRKYWSALVKRQRGSTGTDTLLAMARVVGVVDEVAALLDVTPDQELMPGTLRSPTDAEQRILERLRRGIYGLSRWSGDDKVKALKIIEEAWEAARRAPGLELFDDGWQPPERPPGEEPGGR